MSRNKWFTVDVDGLEALADRRSPAWWIYELVQNSWDEPGVSFVLVSLAPIRGRDDAITVRVIDDAPSGWADLDEASTLFGRSGKAGNPESRGRFMLGDKLFLSICEGASITSTSGRVMFAKDGSKRRGTKTTDRGTEIRATVKVHRNAIPALVRQARGMIPQDGIKTLINDEPLFQRHLLGDFYGGPLATEMEIDGRLRRTRRSTNVTVYSLRAEESPTLFEMGIPVCEHDGDHHIDVAQVIPQSIEREGPTTAYLRDLYGLALNAVADQLDAETAARPWVATGIEKARPAAVAKTIEVRFGKGAVTANPKAAESNAEALAAGRTVIPPQTFSKAGWAAVRAARDTVAPDLAQPSSRAFPTGVKHKAGGSPPLDPAGWSPQMWAVADYAIQMASHVLGKHLAGVSFYEVDNGYQAWYGDGWLSLNLGGGCFGIIHDLDEVKIDELLIHELAHDKVDNHLSHAFHDECCRIGAQIRSFIGRLALAGGDPEGVQT